VNPEVSIGGRYKPDVVTSGEETRPRFWGICEGRFQEPVLFHRRRPGWVEISRELPVYLRDVNVAVVDLDSEPVERINNYPLAGKIRVAGVSVDETPE
jgi:hypothetical protein